MCAIICCFNYSGADSDIKYGLSCKFSVFYHVFYLLLPWMCSLLYVVYETFTFFQITGSNDVIFMNNWWDLTLWGRFSYLLNYFLYFFELFFLNQKTRLIPVIIFKYIILKTRNALKLLFWLKCYFRVIYVFFLLVLVLILFFTPTTRNIGLPSPSPLPPTLFWPKNTDFVIFMQFMPILPKLFPHQSTLFGNPCLVWGRITSQSD